MTRTSINVIVVALLVLLAGCGGKKREGGYMPGRPDAPPPAPRRQNVPLDQALRQQARDELESLADHQDPAVRAHALEMMQLAMEPRDVEPHVLSGLGDERAVVRFAAAMTAGQLQLESARTGLEAIVDDANESVRVAARFALHRLGDTSRSHDLEQLIRSESSQTRGDAALALGLMEEPSAVVLLRPMRNDPDPAVRLQAAEALWRMRQDEALAMLVPFTLSWHPDDQILALLALAGPRDRRVIEHVRGSLTSPYLPVALAAARAMGQLGSDEGYGVALRGIGSADPRERLLACLAFGAIGRTDAQDELAQRLKDADPHVRLAAAAGILQLRQG